MSTMCCGQCAPHARYAALQHCLVMCVNRLQPYIWLTTQGSQNGIWGKLCDMVDGIVHDDTGIGTPRQRSPVLYESARLAVCPLCLCGPLRFPVGSCYGDYQSLNTITYIKPPFEERDWAFWRLLNPRLNYDLQRNGPC